ncbi:MAG: Rieske (2Fe-2S) protein, partial [Planctomycetes bacterium]|nr:Rieske (2Fe-2S) protein [Planctomycetota bacterium]
GTPTRIVLRSDVRDAWTFYRDRIVGSAYFRRMPGDQVIAFSDTCPHLGCKVDYQASNKCFFCPCHQSAFELDGKRRNKTPPRDMDDLKIDVRDGVIWIKYENYKTGEAKKEVIS